MEEPAPYNGQPVGNSSVVWLRPDEPPPYGVARNVQPKPEDFWREELARPDSQSREEEANRSLHYISLVGLPTRRLKRR
jgi:hypothetical protein